MASVAVERATRAIGRSVIAGPLIIGAGETSELVAGPCVPRGRKRLRRQPALEKACDLARKFGGTATADRVERSRVAEADLVVSATMSPLIDRELLSRS